MQPVESLPVVPYDLWSVHLENVEGIARQIWIDEVRFDGLARVGGAFFLQPRRKLWVGPAHADIVSGTITLGDTRLADGLSGSADCQIPPLDPSVPVGIQYYRHISGAVRLDAKISSVRVFDYYAKIRDLPVQFVGGNGALHLEGALQSGVVRPLRADLTLRNVNAKLGEWQTTGTVDATVRTGANGASVWVARIAPLSLVRGEAAIVRLDDSPLRLSTVVPSIDLSRATRSLEIEVVLPRALAPDLRVFNPYVASPGGLRVDGGRAFIAAQAAVSTGSRSATGSVSVDAVAVSARYDTLRVSGILKASAQVTKLDLGSGDPDASEVKIRLRELQVRDSVRTVSGWWGNVQSDHVDLRMNREMPFSASFTSQFQNAAPVLAFSSHTPALPGWVVRFLSGGTMSATGHLRAGSGNVHLTQLQAKTGLLRVEGSYHKRHTEKTGVFQISAGPLAVGIELRNEDTKLIFIGRPVEPRLEP